MGCGSDSSSAMICEFTVLTVEDISCSVCTAALNLRSIIMAVMPFLTFQYKGIQEFLHLAENLQIILNSCPLKLLLYDSRTESLP